MINEEIISMALKAGCYTTGTGALITDDIDLEQFFNLAFAAGAANEREACAKVCDERSEEMKHRAEGEMLTDLGKTIALEKAKTLDMCAAAIRARSNNNGS